MADTFLILANDAEVIRRTCAEVNRQLRGLPAEGIIDLLDGPGWSLITRRNPYVPYAASSDPRGAAVLIGSTLNPNGPVVAELRTQQPGLRIQAARQFCRQLTYGVGISIEDSDLLVTTDYLGLYPIYYYQGDSAFIVTSVPTLLLCYDRFRPTVDTTGLVGILLLAHSSLGHTLFRDVFRLPSGHLLRHRLHGRVSLDRVPITAGDIVLKNVDEAVEAFDSVLLAAISTATSQGTRSVLLSGGLDSRIVAGYLHRLSDGELSAVTLGERRDLEMRAAGRVASTIGAVHEGVPVYQKEYPLYAQKALSEDAMSSGLYALNYWALSDVPRRPLLTGFYGDALMGASHVAQGREPLCDLHTFHAMFTRVNAWGLTPGIVREVVRGDDIDDVILDVYRRLRDEYYSYPGQPWQKSWWFDLYHRQRFLIGRLLKIVAMRSWPVLPYVHAEMLRLAFATPQSLLSDRRIQAALILRKFPALARLPLTGNVDRKWYTIVPGKTYAWSPYVDRVSAFLSGRIRRGLNLPERRYFVRMFDFGGAGWDALRDEARIRAIDSDRWLNTDLVLQLIPPSTTRLRFTFPISEATGRRTLIGAVLCCSQYCAGRQL